MTFEEFLLNRKSELVLATITGIKNSCGDTVLQVQFPRTGGYSEEGGIFHSKEDQLYLVKGNRVAQIDLREIKALDSARERLSQ